MLGGGGFPQWPWCPLWPQAVGGAAHWWLLIERNSPLLLHEEPLFLPPRGCKHALKRTGGPRAVGRQRGPEPPREPQGLMPLPWQQGQPQKGWGPVVSDTSSSPGWVGPGHRAGPPSTPPWTLVEAASLTRDPGSATEELWDPGRLSSQPVPQVSPYERGRW